MNEDPNMKPRIIDLEIEVPGTPEQVWGAIATGPAKPTRVSTNMRGNDVAWRLTSASIASPATSTPSIRSLPTARSSVVGPLLKR